MGDKKDKSLFIPSVDGEHVFEIKTEFTAQLDEEHFEQLQKAVNTPDATFTALAEIFEFDKEHSFIGANLDDVSFARDGSYFNGANLRNSSLRNTEFGPNNTFLKTLLEGADLTGAEGLTEEMLAGAYMNDRTILPDYIDRNRVQHLHSQLNLPEPLHYAGDEGTITIEIPTILHKIQ